LSRVADAPGTSSPPLDSGQLIFADSSLSQCLSCASVSVDVHRPAVGAWFCR
jgi:hypothetical protein